MVQAVLSNHTSIATRSEPWIQLLQAPFVNPDLFWAPFDWQTGIDALDRAGTEDSYLECIQDKLKSIADTMYEKELKAQGAELFLDKTPRYYYLLDHLYDQYPNAKFLVLFRHPVSVLASIHNTWLSGKPFEKLYYYSGDLIDAPRLMRDFVVTHGDTDRVMTVEYESIISDPESSFSSIFSWLNLDFTNDLLRYENNESYKGKYGDPVGVQRDEVAACKPVLAKKFSRAFPNKRTARLAAGLAYYYQQQGYPVPGGDQWEAPRHTREFDRFLKIHQMRNGKSISFRACIRHIFDRLMVLSGL